MDGLWKTTIIIWSDFNPEDFDIEDLSRETMAGGAYCAEQKVEFIDEPVDDVDWDGTTFFYGEEKEVEEI